MRIGIDVGGTHTDAALIGNADELIYACKTSTSANVTDGISDAINKLLDHPEIEQSQISAVMLGTTHCVNAILQRKDLCKVAVIRIGSPATTGVPPLESWPEDLVAAIGGEYEIVHGGYHFNGDFISEFDDEEVETAIKKLDKNCEGFAVVGVFAAVKDDQELRVGKLIEKLTNKPYSLSSRIGSIGLLERENATILNMALRIVAQRTTQALRHVLEAQNLAHAHMYFCQNDGTLMSEDFALTYPILSIACGPTNSIRGASLLTHFENAIVIDIGGTSSDVGVIIENFPRESALANDIGGCRTNFRMPDLVSIALGGGSIVRENNGAITIGPDSVAFKLHQEALVFGGQTMTTTDIAVRLGFAEIGDAKKVAHIEESFAKKVMEQISAMLIEAIEQIKFSAKREPIILVGGGSVIADQKALSVLGDVHLPADFGIANAMGAAAADAGGEVEKIYSFDQMPREQAIKEAYEEACRLAETAGADRTSLQVVLKEEVPLAYLPGNAVRVKIKVAGKLKQI
ncbi:MAG: hydantoinase/oxoprolinase N-terminal domain-containing protein [Spirochaetia bacterium]